MLITTPNDNIVTINPLNYISGKLVDNLTLSMKREDNSIEEIVIGGANKEDKSILKDILLKIEEASEKAKAKEVQMQLAKELQEKTISDTITSFKEVVEKTTLGKVSEILKEIKPELEESLTLIEKDLKRSIKERDSQISSLNTKISSLEESVETLIQKIKSLNDELF